MKVVEHIYQNDPIKLMSFDNAVKMQERQNKMYEEITKNLIWGEDIPKYTSNASYPTGGAKCPLCKEFEIYNGSTLIKKHICKEQ